MTFMQSCCDAQLIRRLRFGPRGGREVFDLRIGRGGQAREDVPKVGKWVKATPLTRFNEGVDDRAAFSRFGFAEEEPVFLTDRRGPDGVLD